MKKISTIVELKEEIALLEIKQQSDAIALKQQFKTTYESLRPVNLIKNTLKELANSPDLTGNIVNSAIGIGAGYLTKKVVIGSTHNPIKQLLGTVLQAAITSVVAKNGDGIKSGLMKLISNLFVKKNSVE